MVDVTGIVTQLLGTLGKGVRALGLTLVGLGLLAMLAPTIGGAAGILVVGVVLLLAGVALTVFGYQAHAVGKGRTGLIVGGVASLCGLIMVCNPVSTLSTVTLLVAIYLVAQGIAQVFLGLRLMPEDGWAWVVVDAGVSILFGLSVWVGWPLSGIRAVGLVVGMKLVSAGAVLVRIEKTMGRLSDRATALRARLGDRH